MAPGTSRVFLLFSHGCSLEDPLRLLRSHLPRRPGGGEKSVFLLQKRVVKRGLVSHGEYRDKTRLFGVQGGG